MTLLERLLDPAVLGTLIPIVAIATLGGWLVVRNWFRHQERMAMIDAGMHPDHPELDSEDEDDREELDLASAERRATRIVRPR